MSLSDPGLRVLTFDEVDDLIYSARAGDLDSLRESIDAIVQAKSCTVLAVLESALDVDDEGLGSASCLLHYPCANGNIEIVQYLLSHINPTVSEQEADSQGKQVLNQKLKTGKLLNHQNISGNTPLHWAGMNGHLEVVKSLIKAGADPSIVNSAGRDAMFESDVSSKEGAAECAVEMLKAYEGLEKGNDSAGPSDNVEEDEANQEQPTSGSSNTSIVKVMAKVNKEPMVKLHHGQIDHMDNHLAPNARTIGIQDRFSSPARNLR